MSDVFREVSEDLRREQLKKLWQRFGRYLIAGAVLIVIIVAAYQYFQSVQERQAAESGDRYQAAADLYADGELEAAEAGFLALAEDGHGGYPTLALMAVGNIRAEQGDLAGAAEAFDAVAADNDTETTLRDAARIRAAYFLVDTAPLSEIRQRLEPFAEAGNPYRVVALEIMALSAVQAEEYDLALEWVVEMVSDPTTSQGTIARASTLFTYILAVRPQDAPAPGAGLLPGLLDPGFGAPGGVPVFNPAAPGEALEPAPEPVVPFGNEPIAPIAPGFNPAAE